MERNRLVTGFLSGFGGAFGVLLALALTYSVLAAYQQPAPIEQAQKEKPDRLNEMLEDAKRRLKDATERRDKAEKVSDAELKKARDLLDGLPE